MKTCKNCYFNNTGVYKCYHGRLKGEKNNDNCPDHRFICEKCHNYAEYTIEGYRLCENHTLGELGIIAETTTKYFIYRPELNSHVCVGDSLDGISEAIRRTGNIRDLEVKRIDEEEQ